MDTYSKPSKTELLLGKLFICQLVLVNLCYSVFYYENIKYLISLILTPVIFLILFLIFIFKKQDEKKFIEIDLAELIWFLFIISIILNTLSKKNFDLLYITPFITLGILMISLRLLSSKSEIQYTLKREFISILLILGVLQSFIGLIQYIFIPANEYPDTIKSFITGTIHYPNGFSSFIGLCILISIILLCGNHPKRKKILIGGLLISLLPIFYIHQCRGAWLCLIITLALFFWKKTTPSKQTKHYRMYIIFCLSILIIGSIYYLYQLNLASSEGRLMIWKISIPMLFENPLQGIGFNNFRYEYLFYQKLFFINPDHNHYLHKAVEIKAPLNQYLHIFCQLGIFGGLLFLSFPIYTLYMSSKKQLDEYDIVLFFILLYLFLHSFFEDILDIWALAFILFFGIGLLPREKIRLSKTIILSRLVFVTGAIGIIIMFTCSYNYVQIYPSIKNQTKGKLLLDKKEYELACKEFDSASLINPHCKECKALQGITRVGLHEYETAIDLLENHLETYHSRNVYLALSLAYYRTNNLKKAHYYAELVNSMFPTQLRPYLLLALINYQIENYEKTIFYLDKCRYPDNLINSKQITKLRLIADEYMRQLFTSEKKEKLDFTNEKEIDYIIITHH